MYCVTKAIQVSIVNLINQLRTECLPGWEVCHAERHLVPGAGVVPDHVLVHVPAAEHLAADQTDPENNLISTISN